jgi:signal transduction histidine kinase
MLERTRGRIAMDLHDDIGSSLTRISVMSEVARRQNGTVRGETLARIGTTARELIDALDDIVWSVDPRHDELLDVLRRIVEFGQQVCEGRGILFETELPGSLDRAKLGLEQRRDLYLILKEAITNAVRHSRASTVTFRVQRRAEAFLLELSDDGTGFTPPSAGPGHGLLSMKERGGRAKLRYSLESAPGSGTRLRLEVRTG